VHLVGFTIEIYYDARPYERQITSVYFRAVVAPHKRPDPHYEVQPVKVFN